MKLTFQIEEMTAAGAWKLTIEAESPKELEEGLSVIENLRSRLTEKGIARTELRFPGRAEFPIGLRGQDEILVL